MNIGILFEVLVQGLKLWNQKEASKYLDQVYELKKRWADEYAKGHGKRSNAILDECEHELYLLSKIFTSTAGKKDL